MAKLPSGTRRRKDGTLEKRFTIDGTRYSVYAVNTKELAEKEQLLREQIKQKCYTKNRNITLNQYFSEWIEEKKKTVKANSIGTYKSHYKNYICDSLGNHKIKDIERREVLQLQTEISKKVSAKSTNHIILVLQSVLSDAVKDEIIIKSPASNIKGLKTNESKTVTDTTHRALTEQEQKDFMQELQGSYYYNYMALMLASGMRYGEVSALTWQDIDYKNNVIHVNKTVSRNEKGTNVIGDSTKSKAGQRDIPMNDTIKRILREHKAKYGILPFATCRIFVSVQGGIIGNPTINREIKKTLKRLADKGTVIEEFTSHAFRDTFATRYIEQGGKMETLKKILGHESITITMDLYAHVLPDTLQDEMNKINICVGL